MADEISITHVMRERQLMLASIMQKHGISLKAVSLDSGIPYSTVRSYFPGERDAVPAIMPVGALFQLIGVIPDELLSLLLPDGRMILRVPVDVDHDEAATAMQDYLVEKGKAHHPDSEDGPALSETERSRLAAKLTVVKAA